MLRELANVFVRPLLVISAIKLWQMGGIPEEGSKVYVCYLQERQRKGCEAIQFHLYPRERMGQIIVKMFPKGLFGTTALLFNGQIMLDTCDSLLS